MLHTDTEAGVAKEIRDLFDPRIGHYPDKSARWLFKVKENVARNSLTFGYIAP